MGLIESLKKQFLRAKPLASMVGGIKYRRAIVGKYIPQAARMGAVAPREAADGKITCLVPYVECYFEHVFILPYLVKALQLRGAEIYFLVCNGALPICESFSRKSPKGKCDVCRFVRKEYLPLFGFNVIDVGDLVSREEKEEIGKLAASINDAYPESYRYHGVDIVPLVQDSLMRYYYGGIEEGPRVKELRGKYIVSALTSVKCAHNAGRSIKPDVVLSHMYAYAEYQPYNQYFEAQDGVRVRCVKGNPQFHATVNLNILELYHDDRRFNRYVAGRPSKRLNAAEQGRLDRFLTSRFKGESDDFASTGYYAGGDDEARIRELGIDPSKKNIFMFTNVEWDVGLSDCAYLYRSVMDWVFGTIDIAREAPSVHLYIKTHPDEKYGVGSRKSVADKIRERYPVLPKNVTIIPPEMKIKPYALCPHMDLGVVFFGTLGLELTLLGVPMATVGIAHYGRKGLTLEPRTIDDYREILLAKENRIAPDRDLLQLYSYFYFIKTNIPFPLTSKFYGGDPNDIRYAFSSADDLAPGKNPQLDHLCDCILNDTPPEAWKEESGHENLHE